MELYVDIQKRFEGFNLNVKFNTDGHILGLLGESGSGKSMTLRCIAGLITPDSGRIVLNGRVLFDSYKGINMPIRKRKVGFLFQNYALFPNMNVEQNIGYALNKLPKKERKAIIDECIEMMHIEDLRKRYPNELSGGQQQRAALARALAVKPEALFLDEPFSALDNHLRNIMVKQMWDTLSGYDGVTVFVTHNLEEAYQLCSKLVILSEGHEEGIGLKEDIFNNPPTVTAAKITGCKNISKAERKQDGKVAAADWKCTLSGINSEGNKITHIGIRAHYLRLASDRDLNSILCWPAYVSEMPFRKLVFMKLNGQPKSKSDYELMWDISNEEWEEIKQMPIPWKVCISPEKIILINDCSN